MKRLRSTKCTCVRSLISFQLISIFSEQAPVPAKDAPGSIYEYASDGRDDPLHPMMLLLCYSYASNDAALASRRKLKETTDDICQGVALPALNRLKNILMIH
jgi:hypothetical protein